MKNPSPYASSPELGSGKQFRLRATDFLFSFLSTVLFSLLALQVATHLPVYQKTNASLNQSREALSSLIVSAHLGERKENGTMRTEADLSKEYVYSLAKGSLLHYGETDKASASFYEEIEPASPTHDALYQYYVDFKVAKASSFSPASESGKEAYASLLLSPSVTSFYEEGDYPYLTLSACLSLDELFRVQSSAEGAAIRAALYANYLSLWSASLKEFRGAYSPYLEEGKVFNLHYKNLATQVTLAFYVGAAFGLFLCEWALPLFFKRRSSLPGYFQSAYYVDQEGNDPSLGNLSLRFAFSLLKAPLLGFLASFALLQISALEILSFASFGAFPLWIFLILSLVSFLAEWAPLLLKKGRPLSLLVSKTYLRYGKEIEDQAKIEKAESE